MSPVSTEGLVAVMTERRSGEAAPCKCVLRPQDAAFLPAATSGSAGGATDPLTLKLFSKAGPAGFTAADNGEGMMMNQHLRAELSARRTGARGGAAPKKGNAPPVQRLRPAPRSAQERHARLLHLRAPQPVVTCSNRADRHPFPALAVTHSAGLLPCDSGTVAIASPIFVGRAGTNADRSLRPSRPKDLVLDRLACITSG